MSSSYGNDSNYFNKSKTGKNNKSFVDGVKFFSLQKEVIIHTRNDIYLLLSLYIEWLLWFPKGCHLIINKKASLKAKGFFIFVTLIRKE